MSNLFRYGIAFIGVTALVMGIPGCFDSEPMGIDDYSSLHQLGRNVNWIGWGAIERFMQFSEKQKQIQSKCAGVQDVNCDGVVDETEGKL